MSVNDVLVQGAEPLFFLDYFACGKLDARRRRRGGQGHRARLRARRLRADRRRDRRDARHVSRRANTTSPASRRRRREGRASSTASAIAPGDAVLGLASSGPHSNGYSLVRKILEREQADEPCRSLLEPTRIYVKPVLALLESMPRQGPRPHHRRRPDRQRAAHPAETDPRGASARTPGRARVFQWLQRAGGVADDEMHRVFNCGIGMVVVVDRRRGRAAAGACAPPARRSTRSAPSSAGPGGEADCVRRSPFEPRRAR